MMERDEYIYGRRAVIEAIDAGRDIDRILIAKDLQGDLAHELLNLIRKHRLVCRRVPVEKINSITRKNHQGVLAILSPVSYYRLGEIVPNLYEEGVLPLMMLLDGITDVRNFGAIARTCECAGANAVVIPERGSVSVGGDAVKTSAGALLRLPVCRERNMAGAAKFLRENGYKIVAVSEKADINYTQVDYTGPVALVMGAEDVGISSEVLKECDTFVSIPMFGDIESLNVSVAAGVMLYEVVRQRLLANLEVI
ncbi:MAG: 23S rRNA (guanosine(2251)-2'-O)-methyltransferase RlmB [Paramuribaculum sp.]|nr:23S rRNA (guanosine(2251)-2'-O)-methyltransferase RlmB [Bacteroides sp.]MDE6825965.1 23S rRNA (guanosine(2251)-2'-O)-methyltransferase RlmB [Paramuribaculum sp.]MDE7471396.1 23S rRNA (guanosine(2251)-2'-O)-methyltransferase RlmB [Paramuribaculum sp.]